MDNVQQWTIGDVIAWLCQVGIRDYIIHKSFIEQKVDGSNIFLLTRQDLEKFDIPAFGDRIKIYKSIQILRQDQVNLNLSSDTFTHSPANGQEIEFEQTKEQNIPETNGNGKSRQSSVISFTFSEKKRPRDKSSSFSENNNKRPKLTVDSQLNGSKGDIKKSVENLSPIQGAPSIPDASPTRMNLTPPSLLESFIPHNSTPYNDKIPNKIGKLSTEEKILAIEKCIEILRNDWKETKGFPLELQSHNVWSLYRRKKDNSLDRRKRDRIQMKIRHLQERRLVDLRKALMMNDYEDEEKVQILGLSIFKPTVDDLCMSEWVLSVIDGPEPSIPVIAQEKKISEEEELRSNASALGQENEKDVDNEGNENENEDEDDEEDVDENESEEEELSEVEAEVSDISSIHGLDSPRLIVDSEEDEEEDEDEQQDDENDSLANFIVSDESEDDQDSEYEGILEKYKHRTTIITETNEIYEGSVTDLPKDVNDISDPKNFVIDTIDEGGQEDESDFEDQLRREQMKKCIEIAKRTSRVLNQGDSDEEMPENSHEPMTTSSTYPKKAARKNVSDDNGSLIAQKTIRPNIAFGFSDEIEGVPMDDVPSIINLDSDEENDEKEMDIEKSLADRTSDSDSDSDSEIVDQGVNSNLSLIKSESVKNTPSRKGSPISDANESTSFEVIVISDDEREESSTPGTPAMTASNSDYAATADSEVERSTPTRNKKIDWFKIRARELMQNFLDDDLPSELIKCIIDENPPKSDMDDDHDMALLVRSKFQKWAEQENLDPVLSNLQTFAKIITQESDSSPSKAKLGEPSNVYSGRSVMVVPIDKEQEWTKGRSSTSSKKAKKVVTKGKYKGLISAQIDQKKAEEQIERRRKQQERRGKLAEVGDRILINPGDNARKKDVWIPVELSKILKPHQIEGVQFMWRNLIMIGHGCILAHDMGLGKTCQVITLIATLMQEITQENKSIPNHLSSAKILILCPTGLIDNWVAEINKWIDENSALWDDSIRDIYVFPRKAKIAGQLESKRRKMLARWHHHGGILLMSYGMFRSLVMNTGGRYSTDTMLEVHEYLLDPGPSVIVCDEGHVIKTGDGSLSQAVMKIRTPSRICLTGYPLQNNLQEFYYMLRFAHPSYIGELEDFKARFINPIQQGMWDDATTSEKKYMQERLFVLNGLIGSKVLRRDISVLHNMLPKKVEFVIRVKLTPLQRRLYAIIINEVGRMMDVYHALSALCLHPRVLLKSIHDRIEKRNEGDEGFSELSQLLEPLVGRLNLKNQNNAQEIIEEPVMPKQSDLGQEGESGSDSEDFGDQELSSTAELIKEISKEANPSAMEHSFKIIAALRLIQETCKIGEKVLLFADRLEVLSMMKQFLENVGISSKLLQGSMPSHKRQSEIDEFNQMDSYQVFLISIRAGSLGANITSASRVILMDTQFNPVHERQAIARAYRLGQTKPVSVYKLQVGGTFEELVADKTEFKMHLSTRVIDKQNTAFTQSKYYESIMAMPAPDQNYLESIEEAVLQSVPEGAARDNFQHDDVLLSALSTIRGCIVGVEVSEITNAPSYEFEEDDMIRLQEEIAERVKASGIVQ